MAFDFKPTEELLGERAWRKRLHVEHEVTAQTQHISTFADVSGDEQHVTTRLHTLVSEPWGYTMTRLLLQEEGVVIRELCQLYGLCTPSDGCEREHWTVRAARQVYEPALLRTISALLQARACPDGSIAEGGRTPLMSCALQGHVELSKALIAARADVRSQDATGRTALHIAAIETDSSMMRLLLNARADPTAPDNLGYTAAHIAHLHGICLEGDAEEDEGGNDEVDAMRSGLLQTTVHGLLLLSGTTTGRDHAARGRGNLQGCQFVAQAGQTRGLVALSSNGGRRNDTSTASRGRREDAADACKSALTQVVLDTRKKRRVNEIEISLFSVGNAAPPLRVTILPVGHHLEDVAFAKEFASLKRPLLLRRAASKLVRPESWTPESLAARVGQSQVEVGTIPYSEDFGGRDAVVATSLGSFLTLEVDLFAPSGAPFYLFIFVNDQHQPQLASFIREELDGLPDRLPPPFRGFHASAMQFAIGNTGSGSPAHFHDDALNILISGRKCWRLWPPDCAAMSRMHPARLFKADAEALQGSTEIIQEVGDVLYVPAGWGHAVLNTCEHTVCVAVEFA